MAIVVSPTEPNPTHYISLTDADGTEVGFITTDSIGDKKPLVSVQPFPSMASQLRQGRGKHADRVPPFEDIPLSDFSGGLAMLHHDEDASKYYDGKRVDTSRAGEVINGPLESYTAGLRDFDESWPGNITWSAIYTGGTTSLDVTFTSQANNDTSYSAASCVLILKKTGSPTGTLTATLSDTNDANAVTKALTINSDCLTDLVSERVEFVFGSTKTLTDNTSYKLKIAISGGSSDSSNYVEVAVDGSTDPYFRVLDATTDFDGIFFELNGGLYFVTQPLNRGVSKLYLYGDRGVADSNTGALSTLVDATKSWTADEWIGGVVKIVAEEGTEEREPYREITDNDDTTLTVSPAWNIAHTTETEYVILYPKWQLVQTFSYYVTDVAVGHNFAYFCFGASQGAKIYSVMESGGAYSETLGSAQPRAIDHALFANSECSRGFYSQNIYEVTTQTSYAEINKYPVTIWDDQNVRAYFKDLVPRARAFTDTDYSGSGANSYVNNGRILFTATAVNGNIGHLELEEPINFEGARYINFRFVAISNSYDAGDLEFGFADSDGNTHWVDLPALTAGESTWCELEISPAPGSNANSYDPEDITDLYLRSTEAVTDNFLIRESDPMISLTMHGLANPERVYLPMNVQINNMIEYIGGAGEIVSRPWIFTWRGPWYESANGMTKLYLGEMEELEHPDNGKGVCVNDVYLYFNVGETIQRYYSGHLDSVGPDVDYGLPEDRIGIPLSMASYPGRVFAGIDAGASGVSSVIYRRNHGWHEAYRAWENERIRRIHAYARADTSDQLFILEGADILYIPLALNPQTDADYEYNYESVLETARIYGGLRETEKYYHAITLVTENLSSTNRWIEVDYKTSENSTWTNITTDFTTSPRQRQSLVSTNDVDGRWIQFRFRMYTNDRTETPKIVSAILDSLERLDSANTYAYNIRLSEGYDHTLREGQQETQTGKEKFDQIQTWVDDPKPLTLSSTSAFEDGKLVFIEPERCKVLYSKPDDIGQEVRVYQLVLIEVE